MKIIEKIKISKESLYDKLQQKRNNMVLLNQSDVEYLKKIISVSGIKFYDLYYVNANKYFTCIQIFDYPQWDSQNMLVNLYGMGNCMVTLDCDNVSQEEYEDRFSKEIKNQEGESELIKKVKDIKKARKKSAELNEFDNHIEKTENTVKTISLRIYVYDKTLEKLQNRFDDIMDMLNKERMKGYVQTDDLKQDYKALTCFSNPVKKMVASETVARMLMLDNVSKINSCVALLGRTRNGVYANDFNSFEYDSYNCILMGDTGSGKSACNKSLGEVTRLIHDIQYILDIDGEYVDYCKELGISRISLSESNYMNMFQIYYVENNDGIIRASDIMLKVASLKKRFATYHGRDESSSIVIHYGLLLTDIYNNYIGKKLTDIRNDEWIIMFDVMDILQMKIKNKEYPTESNHDIYELELGLKDMIETNGILFNHHTNIEVDLNKDICFDISFLRNSESVQLKASYLSQILEFLGQGLFMNRVYNETLAKENGVSIQRHEIPRPYRAIRIKVDEFLQYSLDRYFLFKIESFIKLARKCYAGLDIIIHTTEDLEKANSANGDLLGSIFDLCTNKIIGKIGGRSKITLLKLVTGISENDVETIARFKKGRNKERSFLIVDDKKNKYWIQTLLTNYQRDYFKGGA